MALYLTTHSQSLVDLWRVSIADFIAGLRTRFARYRMYRQTFEELDALSARDLDDLGLSRSTIRQVAWESAMASVTH